MSPPSGPEQPSAERRTARSWALHLALIYTGFGALWFFLGEAALGWLVQDAEQMVQASILMGLVFVLLSAWVIYSLTKQWHTPPAGEPVPGQAAVYTPSNRAALGLLALAIGGFSLINVIQAWQQGQAQLERSMRVTGSGVAERLADWHGERLRSAQHVANRVFLPQHWLEYTRNPTAQALETVILGLEVYRTGPDVAGVALYDHNLKPLWASQPEPTAPYAGDLLGVGVARAMTDGKAGWAGPWRDAAGQVHLSYVGWLAPQAVEHAWVVMHVRVPAHLQFALGQWRTLEPNGQAHWLSASGGTVHSWLAAPDTDWASAVTPAYAEERTAWMLQAMAQAQTPGVAHWKRDAEHISMLLPVRGSDWFVLLQTDTWSIWAYLLRRGGLYTLVGLAAIFSAFALSFMMLQRRSLATTEQALARLQRSRAELASKEKHYRLLTENMADVVWLFDLASDRLLYISPSVEKLTGYTPANMLGFGLEDFLTPDSAAHLRRLLAEAVQHFNSSHASAADTVVEVEHRHLNGGTLWMEISARLLPDAEGRAAQVQGVTRDLRERRRTEHQIRMLSQATEQSPVSVIITNADAKIEYVNPAFERITGYSPTEVLGRNPSMLRSARTPRETYRRMWEALALGQPWQGELVNRRKDGAHYLQSVTVAPLRNERQQVVQYISVQMDITAQRAAEEQLQLLAWYDPLTGLPNRQRLLLDISAALDRHSHRRPGQAGLVVLNVDRFKAINEALGRTLGDQVLRAVAERLRLVLQAGDELAHLNGDEYGLLLFDLGPDAASASTALLRRCDDIHQRMETPLQLEHNTLAVTVSAGATLLGQPGDDSAAEALRRADTALHRAKDEGGQQTVFFDAAMGRLASERFAVEQDLRRGIAAGELRLYLQAQMNSQGQMEGAEALVRWQHPQQGMISPALFIPVAESSGLIEPLGWWVLDQVCRLLGQLRQQGRNLTLSVNVSPRQFHQPNFSQELLRLLHATDAPPGNLVLEITEGVVLREVDTVARRMLDLTQHGIRFSIDDFGTGYSSLSYLKNLPIHELKIDRSFVQDAPVSANDAALVQAMLSVAQHLKLRVVAEGVELEQQAAFFKAHPQVLMQGYLFGRPEPAESLIRRWLQGR